MGGVRPRVAVVCGNLLPARDGVADYTVSLLAAMGERADVWVVTAGQSSSGTAVGEPPEPLLRTGASHAGARTAPNLQDHSVDRVQARANAGSSSP